MGTRRLRALVLVVGLAVTGLAYGQAPDLTPLYQEFGIIFDELGKDTLPYLQQFGLIMDGAGRAEVGKSLFFSLSGGAVFTRGIATFRADNPLTYFDIDEMVGGLIDPGTLAEKLYNTTKTFFLDPGLRLSAGFALANGIELWGHFGIIPQPVATLVDNAVGEIGGLVMNRMNAGGRVRFVLVKDQKGFPAISLGAGYTYTQFALGIDLATLPLNDVDFSGYSVGLGGTLSATTSLHTAGVELAMSKKLAIFAPFLRLGAWYQWASYSAGIEGLKLTLTDDPNPPIEVQGILNKSEQTIRDLAFVVSGGLELVLGKFSMIFQGSYDTASRSPAANVSFQFRI